MLNRSHARGLLGVLGVVLLVLPPAASGRPKAPDPTAFGSYEVLSAEYRFPAMVDPDILSDRATEIWARVHWPDNINQADRFPLLVFLHGNHGTCGTGTNPRVLNAESTKWNQLLPACDGDVSNLQGVRPYDRMLNSARMESLPTQKSYFMVWGANHNFYNTEWQVSDSVGCFNHSPLFPTYVGSASQRLTAIVPLVAFFRTNVGMNPPADPDPEFNQIFNPWYRPPNVITSVTRVDREFVHAPNSSITLPFEYFDKPTGINTYDVPNETSDLFTYMHTTNPARHDPSRRMAAISWRDSGTNVYFQTNWTPAGNGMDVRGFKALDLSIVLRSLPEAPLNFSIRLVHDDGTMSSRVHFAGYHQNPLDTIAGGPGGLHTLLFTTRNPLKDFAHAKLRHVRGIRFTFDAEDVAEASMEEAGWYQVNGSTAGPGPAVHDATPARYETANADINSGTSNNNLTEVVVTYSSLNLFTPQAELFQLETKGELISNLSAPSNDLSEISFMVSAADYQKLLAAPDLQIRHGNELWVIPTGPRSSSIGYMT